MRIGIRDIARSGHVTRWHGVRTLREQTLAEHHFMVTVIAMELARRILQEELDPSLYLLMIEYALHHDSPELLMGDIPTPTKRRIEQILNGDSNPFDVLEELIAPEVSKLKSRIKGTPYAIIAKLADIIDAIVFICEEGSGAHAKLVRKNVSEVFAGKISEASSAFPKYSWNEAELLLDEMLNGVDNQVQFEI